MWGGGGGGGGLWRGGEEEGGGVVVVLGGGKRGGGGGGGGGGHRDLFAMGETVVQKAQIVGFKRIEGVCRNNSWQIHAA